MKNWMHQLRYNPVIPLLESGNEAIIYLTRQELLSEKVAGREMLWNLPETKKVLGKQCPSGCWKYSTRNKERAPAQNYDLFQTFKQIAKLIDVFQFNKEHSSIQKAAEYIFSCQTDEGDIRGIIGNQYAPYYTGIIMSLLIKAGYGDDSRIEKGFDWLLSMRQDDGGWVIGSPGFFGEYTYKEKCDLIMHYAETKKDFDRTKPFAHSGTGMVIRAFALHPHYRMSKEANLAANLLKSHFFKEDNYYSYKSAENWLNFKYPFFWTDLLSALDSVSLIGIPKEDHDVCQALEWFVSNQQESGLWKNSYSRIHKASENTKSAEARLWISLAICRIFQRYYGD
jgi:Squalene-hopene cyclase C-terminal domain